MPDQKQSILIGAAVTAVLSTSYLGLINCLCCAGVIIGSLVTVWHYTSRHGVTIEAGRGAVMGVIAVALGALVALVINFVLMKMGAGGQEVIYESLMNTVSGFMSPEQAEMMQEQMEAQMEAQRDMGFGAYILNGLLPLFVYCLMGAVGGAVGAAVFKKGGEEPSTEL